jgi:hypothetical protein
VVAISGDYYSARQEGVVVRNGYLYRRHGKRTCASSCATAGC